MKQIEKLAAAENFGAINIGKLAELGDYLLELGPEIKIPGKVFGGSAVGATGAEFSRRDFESRVCSCNNCLNIWWNRKSVLFLPSERWQSGRLRRS